jgi:hypothetical protein
MADSRDVNKYIAAEIWPKLRELGFDSIKGRVASRTHADRVDLVQFTTFSSYEAQRLELKPGSFAIALGCHLEYVTNPIAYNTAEAARVAKAEVAACLLRAQLRRSYMRPFGLDREIWAVGVPGVPFDKVMSAASDAVLGEGAKWFEQFRTPLAVYELLESREEHMSKLWGFGNRGSPIRHYLLGYAALAAGKVQAARTHCRHALETGLFPGHADRLRSDAGLP